jgi:hypothetical protein
MRLFRSEEHLRRWLSHGNPRGESLSLEQQWTLAFGWFEGRHLGSWRRRTTDEAREVFRKAGLVSDFWSLE